VLAIAIEALVQAILVLLNARSFAPEKKVLRMTDTK
jgi:hypothetical protein